MPWTSCPISSLHHESARSLASWISAKVLPARSCCLTDRDSPFNLSLLPGVPCFRRIGDKAAVAFEVGIGVVDGRVADVGFHNAGFEVVENNPRRHALEPCKGTFVAVRPCGDALMEDEADEPVAAIGEGHDEGPCLALLLHRWVVHEAGVSEVDLGLVAGRRLDADGHVRGGSGKLLSYLPLDGRIGDVYLVILF